MTVSELCSILSGSFVRLCYKNCTFVSPADLCLYRRSTPRRSGPTRPTSSSGRCDSGTWNRIRMRRHQSQLGLVVTEGSKVPIWKALTINGLRHGVRSNLLILSESQLCQCDTHLAARMPPSGASSIETGPSPRRVDLAGKKSAGTDLASADIALALAADAADGGAISPEDASDIGIAAEAISMPFARPPSAKVHIGQK